jgi:hypothetical protein
VLAYPDPAERSQRDKFHQATIRWILEKRMDLDEKWARGLQLIRPAYFSGPDSMHNKILAEGSKRLNRRRLVAYTVLLPHLRKFDTGRVHRVEGFLPTFENMISLATTKLGLSPGSVDTVKHRDWRPVKPVAHAICAHIVWDSILWKMWGRKPDADRAMAFLMLPEYVQEVVDIAEHFRQQVCEVDEFKIREDQTIRLVSRWLSEGDVPPVFESSDKILKQ